MASSNRPHAIVPIVISPDPEMDQQPATSGSLLESPTTSGQPTSGETDDESSLDLNNVEVIEDLNVNRVLMRLMRLGASYVSTGSNGYRTGSISSSSSGSRSRRLSVTNDTSASNLLRPPNTSRGRRFSDSININVGNLIQNHKQSRKGDGVPYTQISTHILES